MKAAVIHAVGEYPKYQEFNIEGKGSEVLLKASALNHRDIWIVQGKYPGLSFPCILGSDGAGIHAGDEVIIFPSIEWGSEQSHQSRNFRVLGMPDAGTFAESIFISEANIFPKPSHLDFFESAALPLAGLTAYRALFTKCQPNPDDKILINGAGGGVASIAMLFAIGNGNEVYISTGSKKKIDYAKKLGAAEGFLYTDEKWLDQLQEASGGVDIIIDSAGGPDFSKLMKVCNFGARIGIYGGTLGEIEHVSPQAIFWKQISIHGSTMGSAHDFQHMLSFVNEKEIHPIVHKVLPLSRIEEGIKIMEQGDQFGKIVFDNSK